MALACISLLSQQLRSSPQESDHDDASSLRMRRAQDRLVLVLWSVGALAPLADFAPTP